MVQAVAQADMIRLLLLTGARKLEIVRLKRREVDGDRFRLEDSKTGPRTVYLSPEAREVVERRMAAAPGEFLFPSPVIPDRPVYGNLTLWQEIRREIGIEDLRPAHYPQLPSHLAARGEVDAWIEETVVLFDLKPESENESQVHTKASHQAKALL